VSVITGHRVSIDVGTRTARCALAMMNVSNILLFDEEDLMREATALLLGNRGARVTKSATLDEALAQLERRTYHVVVVDLHNALSNPAFVLQRIVEKTTSPTRVIVCTDQPVPNVDPTSISDVLVKPYPFDRLVEAVFGPRPTNTRSRPLIKALARRVTTHRRSTPLVRRGRA
jgi:DNA-binding NtrC family response regulator